MNRPKNENEKKSFNNRLSDASEHHGLSYGKRQTDQSESDYSYPSHLLIMIHGMNGRCSNWNYAAKEFKNNYPEDVFVHCSKCNSSRLTFHGVDEMGRNLAEEVRGLVTEHPKFQKISFLGHSVGGLVARYAIAELYTRDPMGNEKIAGLEPMNFITSATPHLGSRGNKQVPILCGFQFMEKLASFASRVLGRTVRHLFLTDVNNKKLPLLLQMVNDCEDLQFMSALLSFRRRVAYANTRGDILVGRCTSSLRRPNELPKTKHFSRNDKYPHIVCVELPKTKSHEQKIHTEVKTNGFKNLSLEEKMIRGLTKARWERVDVSFNGIKRIAFAHSTMQVKNYSMNSDGADVISHMIDNFQK